MVTTEYLQRHIENTTVGVIGQEGPIDLQALVGSFVAHQSQVIRPYCWEKKHT